MTAPLLRVDDLSVQFQTDSGPITAVSGVSFTIDAGEIVGLVGESGAGKSATAKCLLRLLGESGEIVSGSITYRGEQIVSIETDAAGRPIRSAAMLSERTIRDRIRGNEIAMISQESMASLNPVYTVGEQLREFIELNRDLAGANARREALDTLREVGIPDPDSRYDEYPHQFSGGMRQRVLIAMALACRPSLIIADEPTTALDVTVEGQILDLVTSLQETYGTSVLWITHDLGVVATICDRVNVMYLGEIVEHAPVDELFYDTSHPYTRALLASMPRPDQTLETLTPIDGVMPSPRNAPAGCRFHTRCPDARAVCRQVSPEPKTVSEIDGVPHQSACLKHDVFDVGYDTSPPLDDLDQSSSFDERPSGPRSGDRDARSIDSIDREGDR